MINIDDLIGKKMIGEKAAFIGEVKGVLADIDTWQITHLLVKLTNEVADELGQHKRFGAPTVSFPVKLIKAVGDVVTVQKSVPELRKFRTIAEYKQ